MDTLNPGIQSRMHYGLPFGIGVVAGLRSLTAPAVVAMTAYFGWLDLKGSSLAFMGSLPAVIIFSVLAIAELIGDKLPTTPKRTALASLFARIVSGALCGACLCAPGGQPLTVGAILGGIGALIGAFGGYEIRRRLVTNLGLKDFIFAIGEDIVAIALAFFVVAR